MNSKIKLLCALALFASPVLSSFAGPPEYINYQGLLNDASGQPLASQNYTLEFNIYNAASGGTKLWGPFLFDGVAGAGHGDLVPVANGQFNVIIGHTDTSSASIRNAFGSGNQFIEIKVNGGSPILPRQQFLSTPYAFSAATLAAPGSAAAATASGNNVTVVGPVTAASFSGIGSGLISLNASNLVSGTVSDARLSSNVPKISGGNTFTGNQIFNSGNVGIGQTSPQAKLHIKQSVDGVPGNALTLESAVNNGRWNIGVDGVGDLIFGRNEAPGVYCYLAPGQNGLISVSDRRAKKDIVLMDDCLDRVMQLQPSSFRYTNAPADSALNYGFIAQEVETVFPDLVLEKNGLKTLVAAGITAINTRAIQELAGKLQVQETELSELRSEVARLRGERKTLAQTISDLATRFADLEKAARGLTTRTMVNASADAR